MSKAYTIEEERESIITEFDLIAEQMEIIVSMSNKLGLDLYELCHNIVESSNETPEDLEEYFAVSAALEFILSGEDSH